MAPTTIKNRFVTLTDDEILYEYYSYDWLEYISDVLKGFYETYKKTVQEKDPLFDKKCSILKFEIVAKFCHYAELVGVIVYPSYAGNVSLKSADILENLSKYTVRDIDDFYQDLHSRIPLDMTRLNNFKHLFGYDRIKHVQGAETPIENSLTSITKVLRAIGEFYIFWKGSYNAYKHGYRLWPAFEYEQKLNVVIYLDKYNKSGSRDIHDIPKLPIDDETINNIHDFSKCCRSVLDIFFHNQRELLKAKSASLNNIEFVFLDYVEPITKVRKIQFNVQDLSGPL